MRAFLLVVAILFVTGVTYADSLSIRDVYHVTVVTHDDGTVAVTTTDATPVSAQMRLANLYTIVLHEDGKQPRPYATFRVTELHGSRAIGRLRPIE